MDMFVGFTGVEVVVIEARTKVVIDSVIGVATDKLTDVFIDVCANILLEVALSDIDIIVLGAAVIALEFAVSVP